MIACDEAVSEAMLPGSCVGMVVASIDALLRSSACCFCPRLQLDDVEPLRAGTFCMCPISVESSMETIFFIACCIRPGHPLRYPALAVAVSVHFGREPRLAWYYCISWTEFTLQVMFIVMPLEGSYSAGSVSGMIRFVPLSVKFIQNRLCLPSLQPLYIVSPLQSTLNPH